MTRHGLAFLLAAMCASSATVASAAQGGGGGQGQGAAGSRGTGAQVVVQGRMTPPAPPPVQPSLNRPSFPIDGLNRPAFPLTGPVGIGPAPPSPFAARPGTFTRLSRGPRSFGVPLGYGFGVPVYADTYVRDTQPPPRDEDILIGILYLDVTPRTAMVFIDTAYVGTVDDLLFNGVRLSRGRHWLELEAPGYEKKLIEINITPGQPLRYRVDLTPIRQAALTLIPPRPPETMYAIPGCYAGNRPPVAGNLPPGCDIANVRVLRPPRPN